MIVDSYSCRGRDDIAGAKISEHGFANAIDIGAFRVGKRWIEVGGDTHPVDDARNSSTHPQGRLRPASPPCSAPATVPRHHFHLDLGPHGGIGESTICP